MLTSKPLEIIIRANEGRKKHGIQFNRAKSEKKGNNVSF